MSFDQELEKRLSSVRQKQIEQEERARLNELHLDLVLKTKGVIDPVLKLTTEKFKNATSEPTHDLDPVSGQLLLRFGTGHLCYIDFKQDSFYGFPKAFRLAYLVEVQDVTKENITIKSAVESGTNALSSFRPILDGLKSTKSRVIFSGTFNANEIRTKIQESILDALDSFRTS